MPEPVESGRQLAGPARHLVGGAGSRRSHHGVGQGRQGPQHVQLTLVHQHRQIHVVERCPLNVAGRGHPPQRVDAGVRVLHVVDGVLG